MCLVIMCTYYREPTVRYNEHSKYIIIASLTGVFLNMHTSIYIILWGAAVLL